MDSVDPKGERVAANNVSSEAGNWWNSMRGTEGNGGKGILGTLGVFIQEEPFQEPKT